MACAKLLAQEKAKEERAGKKKAKELEKARRLEARKVKERKKDKKKEKVAGFLPDEEDALSLHDKDLDKDLDKHRKGSKKDHPGREEDALARKDGLELPEERGPPVSSETTKTKESQPPPASRTDALSSMLSKILPKLNRMKKQPIVEPKPIRQSRKLI